MSYEVSQRFRTVREPGPILDVLEEQFRKVSKSVVREGDRVVARSVARSFLSVGKNSAAVRLTKKEGGYLCVADVDYSTNLGFWLALVICVLLWGIPAVVLAILYFIGKKPMREAVEKVLTRVKDEVEE